MGKKDKSAGGLAVEFKAMVEMVPKLDKLLKAYDEITAGYLKYRKSGGASIPGIEKHLGVKMTKPATSEQKKSSVPKPEKAKTAKTAAPSKNTKKKS
jgi:hypothetical protein